MTHRSILGTNVACKADVSCGPVKAGPPLLALLCSGPDEVAHSGLDSLEALGQNISSLAWLV